MKSLFPLILGLAAGVFVVYSALGAIERAKKNAGPAVAEELVVATSDIPYATELKAEMLTTQKFGGCPLPGKFTKVDELVGRVTATRVVKNTLVLVNMLAPAGASAGAENLIPPEHRPVAIRVKAYTVKHLEPGNHVDVWYSTSGRNTSGEPRSEVVMQNVEVFSAGSMGPGTGKLTVPTPDPKAPVKAAPPTVKESDTADTTVVLLVPTTETSRLTAIAHTGNVTLVQRRAGDTTIYEFPGPPEPEPVVAAPVADAEPATSPAVTPTPAPPPPPPPAMRTVTVIEGAKDKSKEFPDEEEKPKPK